MVSICRAALYQECSHTRKERSFHKTQNESTGKDAGEVLNEASHGGHETPSNREAAQVERWPTEVVEQEVGRHLRDNVTDEEDGKTFAVN